MAQTNQEMDRQWGCEQIEKYQAVKHRYQECAEALQQVLEKAIKEIAPLSIVQTRPKSPVSFTEKAIRKKKAGRYTDPLMRMTDLCGGRVITQTLSEVEAVCKFIEKHFEVDLENSLDVSQRLKPSEFGYRSVHYVVQFKPGVFPTKEIPIEIPDDVYPDKTCPMKAEIQVRTLVEHAWAGFGHDRVYKSAFTVPVRWQRELAVLAGMLEEVDQSFTRIQAGLQTYAANYGAYMNKEQMCDEIEILETVLTCDSDNPELAHRIGMLAMTLGDWQKATGIFTKYVKTGYQPILRDLGVVLCKVHAKNPTGPEYRQGQKYLELASSPPYQDADALASLAGTWKALNKEKVRDLYRQAFDVDSSDPYAVSNYLVYEVAYRQDLTPVSLMKPAIRKVIQRCRDQADVGMNLPWAYYNLGIFYLLLGQPYDSLNAYAKAVQLSTNDWMIETSLRLLDQLAGIQNIPEGYAWVRSLLLISCASKFPDELALEQVKGLASPGTEPLSAPVVIVTGGCDASIEQKMRGYRDFLIEAFRDFNGTILSGGTTAGISGLTGKVGQTYPGAIRTIGYVPKLVPAGIVIDKRYSQIRRTQGSDFSALEPLQTWIDLMACGIKPSQVKLLGINGGTIAAAEYRMALALGATVAIVEGSGGEASKLFPDDAWSTSKNLLRLPSDAMTARAFIGSIIPQMEPPVRESLAKEIHNAFRDEQKRLHPNPDPAYVSWDELQENLKESNRLQADYISEKLHQIGCTLQKVDGQAEQLEFTESEVDIMAKMEHGRWVVERLQDGWKWAEKRDVEKKLSPYLVPWSQLTEEMKNKDRDTVRKIPQFLAVLGMEVKRTRSLIII